MNLCDAITRFPDQQWCINYLEAIRFKNGSIACCAGQPKTCA